MKAIVSALALMSFVGAATIPAVAHAQTTAPAKKTTKKAPAKKKASKKAPAKKAM
ncbi:MAG TPA: hypothetical protein VL574_05370 [Stellaceae bacterium]|jgi:hypothetical protein|nr:hypothetical protein [Stellaceae bacterium]